MLIFPKSVVLEYFTKPWQYLLHQAVPPYTTTRQYLLQKPLTYWIVVGNFLP
jgi:hypothetical protein